MYYTLYVLVVFRSMTPVRNIDKLLVHPFVEQFKKVFPFSTVCDILNL